MPEDGPDTNGDTTPEGQAPPVTSIDSLPDWAKKELADTRAEAANYRTRLREAESSLKEAKTPEEVEAAVKELREGNAKLERDLALANASRGLTDDQAAILAAMTWETPGDLTGHVEAIRKLTPSDDRGDALPLSGTLRGGLTPGDEPGDDFDPAEVARKMRQGLL